MLNLTQGFIRPWGKFKRRWKPGEIPKDKKEFLEWLYDHGYVKTEAGVVKRRTKNGR